MDKIWLSSYPAGVPAEIDPERYVSLVELMEEAFQTHARRKAYVCMGKYLSYAEVDALSAKVAAWLQMIGLRKGARVAIMMPNVLQYPVVVAAILRAGYIVVNVNPLYTARELEHQLSDSGAEVIFVLENFAATLAKVVDKTPIRHIVVTSMGDLLGRIKGPVVNFVVRHLKHLVPIYDLPTKMMLTFDETLNLGSLVKMERAILEPEDIAFLQYTGGTTGLAKGAMLTHRNLVANVLQAEEWLLPGLRARHDVQQSTFVCALPLYHIFALTVCGLLGTRIGALNLLIPNPRDIPGFIKELSKHKVNTFPAVNTLFNALLNDPEFAKLDFSGYACCVGGGMAVQQAVAERWKKLTGCAIIEGYGLSETSPIASANPSTITEYSGTIGLPLPSTEIAILDDAGQPVPIGARGEIGIRGPQVMAGYWNRPLDTQDAFTEDGFFKSGDIGIMDAHGYTRIVDRKKDMILVSGFNVYPNEIEGVMAQHPGILECACVGVPDEHTGEAVKLFVVRRDPTLTAEQLMAYCKEQFTGYKKPKYIEFRDDLPKSGVGKILRRELRGLAQAISQKAA
ncbi:long-chain-fatty-acid--CoA ligase [Herbaspirillum sp. RTI4]|uniref:long-chain-fatty-acid--CoA ligase n=1 Tax=Herbaspirillum sp. RTI4 TaxID=3048640 RepID=UPI002AB34697|nr:long-chain-fatty-acid--CoA ligase [Herbaspirillum sp. RTI4]MDY7577884.1 long-chain-fatty-acid--CoA ligase [Herbaspirillum sp. RTI4]MEA9981670.1 long-chain-fatty-acid--CoA ligase [Herbaspirillum sp. RTI4]